MNFYPVYRLCRYTGSFARIGSFLAFCQHWSPQLTPHVLKQTEAYFEQKPGELIVVGPRCAPVVGDALPDEGV
jgi:hypothetical protein